ncbi:hypothetical protein RU639_008658 [Aspergillus parasiticus]
MPKTPQPMVERRRPDHRRRQTVIRKLRRLCDDYNAKVVIVMTEPNNRQWIYKSHDDVPGIQQAIFHPRNRNIYDFAVMNQTDEQGRQRQVTPHDRQKLSPQTAPQSTVRRWPRLMPPPRYRPDSPAGVRHGSPPTLPRYHRDF